MLSSLRIAGVLVGAVGLVVLVIGLVFMIRDPSQSHWLWVSGGGALLFLLGVFMFCGILPESFRVPGGPEIIFRPPIELPCESKMLSEAERADAAIRAPCA